MEEKIRKSPVVGFVRYSQKILFGNGPEERNMFESEYFEYRFNIFINVTLPSFKNQTLNNFVLLLLHSEKMPQFYKEKFLKLEKENNFLQNLFLADSPESFNNALSRSVGYVEFKDNTAVTFRIDNDDAVQNDFIEKLSCYLKRDFVGYAVSVPQQYIVKRIGLNDYLLQENYYPSNSIGLAYVCCKENYKTIMELGNHHLTNEKTSLILLESSTNGGLMTINGENALNSIDESKAIVFSEDELKNYLNDKNIAEVDMRCLRIFPRKKRFLFEKILDLIIPPIAYRVLRK